MGEKALSQTHTGNIFRHTQSQQPPKQPPDQNEESHLLGGPYNLLIIIVFMAPEVGLEPTTLRLTAECSAIELLRIALDTPQPAGCRVSLL
jgi:hypothetical protein